MSGKTPPSRMQLEIRRSMRSFLLLLWLVLCGLIASWVIFKNQTFERPWTNYVEVRAEFDDVKGVQAGRHHVRIAGVKVGVVKEIELDGTSPVLTLSIEEKYAPIYRDARMRIRPQTPLNDMYVVIEERGDPEAGELGPDEVIATEQTVEPVDISRVLNTFDDDARRRLATLMEELDEGLDEDSGRQLQLAFAELAPFLQAANRASGVLERRRRWMARFVHDFGNLTGSLARRDAELELLIRTGNATLGELAANDSALAATISELPATLTSLEDSFTRVRAAEDSLDPAFRALLPVANELESGLGSLQEFGELSEPAFRELRPAVNQLTPLLGELEPVSDSLKGSFARLRPRTGDVDRVTRDAEACLFPLQKFLHWSLSTWKLGDANAAYTRSNSTIGVDSGGGAIAGEPNIVREQTCSEALR